MPKVNLGDGCDTVASFDYNGGHKVFMWKKDWLKFKGHNGKRKLG